MDEVLERGIVKSFPDECLQKIVRRQFRKLNQCEEQQKMDTLAMKTIKSRMHKELMTDETDVYSQFIYKLIFKEPFGDIEDFYEEPLIRRATALNQHPDESNGLDSRKDQFHRMRLDGPFMFALLSQNMPRSYDGVTQIIVTRLSLRICLDGPCIADIPHRDGIEYDTYWAEKFTKLVMSKYANDVILEMNGEDLPADQFNREFMGDFLNKSILDKLPRVTPPEGWQQYMSTERPIYLLLNDNFDRPNYCVHFSAEDVYSESEESMYWSI